jgi:phosphate/phosphite/phosphonate ABC transporter binding protein
LKAGIFFMQKIKISFFVFCFFIFILLPVNALSQADDEQHDNHFFFAVSAMASPAQTLVHFAEFRDYLEEKLEIHVHLKQRRTYEEINTLLYDASVQMAFTCTGGYLAGRQAFGLEVLAVPVVKGKTAYQSYIITSKKNPAKTLEELRGQIFAFTDPLSLSGRIYPVATLNSLGYMTKSFFKKTFYTESHDKSIEAVATGLADAAAVDSLIFDSLYGLPDSFARQVRIIHKSKEFGMPPVVVTPGLDKESKRTLLKVLLGMANDPRGQIVLQHLEMDGFAIPTPELYRSAILLRKQLKE